MAQAEVAGIPSCVETWDDAALISITNSAAMKNKVPQIRHVLTPPDTGIKDLSKYTPDFIKALTSPLTDLEKASGTYQAPIPPRIAMTGTYDEIMAYFEGDMISPSPLAGGPWAWMTDGGAIVPPTEERVAQMLKGTKHKPTEEIRGLGSRISEDRIASIEKVAVNAVMAGCKPEYFPVVLAIAEAGACTGYTGDCPMGHMFVTSGPIGKEIGLNYGFGFLAPGNKAGETLRRACVLMGINLAGLKFSLNDGERMANTMWGQTFSESPLTPWETLNKQNGYTSDNSILYNFGGRGYIMPGVEPHGTDTGSGADTLLEGFQVGSPEQLVEAFTYMDTSGSAVGSLIFTSDAANTWINKYGFKTADDLKKYLYENALVSMAWAKRQYYPAGRIVNFDAIQVDAKGMIRKWDLRSNKDYKTLQIIVAGGAGPAWGMGVSLRNSISIDKWR